MSSWIHVNAAIRINDTSSDDLVPDFDELIGKECIIDSPESIWDDMKLNPDLYLPMGSEGSLQKSVCIYASSYSVMIFGDLRDCNEDDAKEIMNWFAEKCNKINETYGVCDAVITVRVNADKPLIFVYDHFKKYRDGMTDDKY